MKKSIWFKLELSFAMAWVIGLPSAFAGPPSLTINTEVNTESELRHAAVVGGELSQEISHTLTPSQRAESICDSGSESGDEDSDWEEYFESKGDEPPSPRSTLVNSLELIEADNHGSHHAAPLAAIDLGCGTGGDTIELLRKKTWNVLAIDKQKFAIRAVGEFARRENLGGLSTQQVSFEQANLGEKDSIDLVNASFSLPFCKPKAFPRVWSKITSVIKPGGYFAGHFFGPKHTATDAKMKLPENQVRALFPESTFEIISIKEVKENDDDDDLWHEFHVIAKKRNISEQ